MELGLIVESTRYSSLLMYFNGVLRQVGLEASYRAAIGLQTKNAFCSFTEFQNSSFHFRFCHNLKQKLPTENTKSLLVRKYSPSQNKIAFRNKYLKK